MPHFRRSGHIDGRPRDSFGHLGHRALQPVEWPEHPPRERTSREDGQNEQAQTAQRHPHPTAGDVACCHRGVHRDYDCTDQLAVMSHTRSGQNRVGVPGHDACPGRRWCIDQGAICCHRNPWFVGGESTCGQGLAVCVDDQQIFPVYLVVAVDDGLHAYAAHRGGIGQRGELASPFLGQGRGTARCRTQR